MKNKNNLNKNLLNIIGHFTFVMFLVAFLLSASSLVFPTFKISPVLLVIAGGIVGVLIKSIKAKGGKKK